MHLTSSTRVAYRFLTSGIEGWNTVNPKDLTPEEMQKVWDIYEVSYSKIGMPHSSVSEMVGEYPHWDVFYIGGLPAAMTLYKVTPFGKKMALGGSDGTPAGKLAMKEAIMFLPRQRGTYAEVSGALEHIMMKVNPPVVCAALVPEVLHKKVTASPDGLHYSRMITGVGSKEKILVGTPKGIPTTTVSHPVCPLIGEGSRLAGDFTEDDVSDIASHLSCMLDY